MRFRLFQWIQKPKWIGPLRGIKFYDLRVDAPPPDASAEQWLDFAAVAGLWNPAARIENAWAERALRAYLAKWPALRAKA